MSRQGLRPGDIRLEQQAATTARGMRRPEYNFGGRSLDAYRLYPMVFCPVLAGDTVATCNIQARVIANSLVSNDMVVGSWFEHWLFFVRIGDMADAENIRDVLISPAGTDVINWRDQCMQAIWKVYFRDEHESVNWSLSAFLRNPRVGWWDSSRDASDLPDTSGAADDWETDWIRYQAMRRAKLTTKTWEEYLGAQGINVPPQMRVESDPEQKVPELIKYTREFVYPQMSMAPSDGGSITPKATLQWFVNDKLDRGRFCAEPGFFVSCIAVRDKRYVVGYDSLGSSTSGTAFDPLTVFNDAIGWQPIDLDTDPHSALVAVPGAYFGDTVAGHDQVLDTRDILLFGHDEWITNDTRNAISSVGINITRMNPQSGSRPINDTGMMTYNVDARLKFGIKSRVNKDTTR